MLLYQIDVHIQQYLHSLKHSAVPLCTIPTMLIDQMFQSLQMQVVMRQVFCDLPKPLLADGDKNSKKRDSDERSSLNSKKNRQEQYESKSKGKSHTSKAAESDVKPLTNSRTNPKWLLQPGRRFGECFHDKRDDNKPPTNDGKPFCIQYFVSGVCKRGENCQFSHVDPRDVNLESEFNTFCQKAYSKNKT